MINTKSNVMCEQTESASIVFICVTHVDFSTHHNIPTFCEEFKNTFTRAIPRSEWSASKGALSKRIDTVLEQMVKKYNTSNLLEANAKVDQTKTVMSQNIDMALQNSERIEDLDQKSQDLEKSSKDFHDKSKKVKCRMLEQRAKLIALLAVVVVVIVIIIVVGVVASGGGAK
eukprot:UN04675